jgi:NhaA family Na+:H+ antiporter
MWWFMLTQNHATVTGVLLAFIIVWRDKDSTSSVLQHFLHKPVGFLILPLCTGKYGDSISSNIGETIAQHYSIGIALGLIVGKPLGIYLFSLLAVSLEFVSLPLI